MKNSDECIVEKNGTLVKYCGKVSEFDIPKYVTKIQEGAFEYNNNLVKIVIPSSVVEIDVKAFNSCKQLIDINVKENNEKFTSINGVLFSENKDVIIKFPNARQGEYTIPCGVSVISDYTFYGCQKITNVIIPNGVTQIGVKAFMFCISIKRIEIPKGITSILEGTFRHCRSMESVVIPSGVTKIGKEAFYECLKLDNVKIPMGVTEIEWGAFAFCNNLRFIDIPVGISKINYNTFSICKRLESIIIPEGVTEIEGCSFGMCNSLRVIEVPKSISSIDEYSFYDIDCIDKITFKNGNVLIGKRNFENSERITSINEIYILDDVIGKDLKKLIKSIIGVAIKNDNVNTFESLVKSNAITRRNIKNLIGKAEEGKATKVLELLLDWQSQNAR